MMYVFLLLMLLALGYLVLIFRKFSRTLGVRIDDLTTHLKSNSSAIDQLSGRLGSWERVRSNNFPVFPPAMLLERQTAIDTVQSALEKEWKAWGYGGPEEAEVRKLKEKGMDREKVTELVLRQAKDLAEYENHTRLRTAMIKANINASRGVQTVEEAEEEVRFLEARLFGDEENKRREAAVKLVLAGVFER